MTMFVHGSRRFARGSLARPIGLLVVALSFWVSPALAGQPVGPYTLYIGGYYHGTATGTIQGHHLDIAGTVQTDDGGSGAITATHLQIKGVYFSGNGTICGHAATFTGRFDQPAAHPTPGHIGHGRMVITFTVDDGHLGRIVGVEG